MIECVLTVPSPRALSAVNDDVETRKASTSAARDVHARSAVVSMVRSTDNGGNGRAPSMMWMSDTSFGLSEKRTMAVQGCPPKRVGRIQ